MDAAAERIMSMTVPVKTSESRNFRARRPPMQIDPVY
jgi:hypothetical protein